MSFLNWGLFRWKPTPSISTIHHKGLQFGQALERVDQDVFERKYRREQRGDISVEPVGRDTCRQAAVAGRQVRPVRLLQRPKPIVRRCGYAGEGRVGIVGLDEVRVSRGQPVDT